MNSNPERRTRRLRDSNCGLSLVELVMATAVFGVGFVLLAGSLGSMNVSNKITEKKQTALSQISTLIEDIQGNSFSELMAYTTPTLHGLGDDVSVTAQVYNSGGALVNLPISDASVQNALPNPVEVRFTVRWKEGYNQYISKRSSFMVRR